MKKITLSTWSALLALACMIISLTYLQAHAAPFDAFQTKSEEFYEGGVLIARILAGVIAVACLIFVAGKYFIDTASGNQQARFGSMAWTMIGIAFILFVVVIFAPQILAPFFSGSDVSSPFG